MSIEAINLTVDYILQFWDYLKALPADQLVAFAILCILLIVYSFGASVSYSIESASLGRKKVFKIEKTRNWPGKLLKIIWIYLAYRYSDQLWISAIVAILTVYLTIFRLKYFVPFLKWIQPTISDREEENLRRKIHPNMY